MKITERKGGAVERHILIDMITNPHVLPLIAPRWTDEGLFSSPHANIIGRWCVKHYRRCGEPPNRGIGAYLDAWSEKQSNEHLVEMVRELLHSVGDEYDYQGGQTNPLVRLDQANQHFTAVSLRRSIEKTEAALQRGDIDAAQKAHSDFTPLEISEQKWTDLFADEQEFLSTFSHNEEKALFEYEGDLQSFVGNTFSLGEFVAFLAGPKTGKSWTLADVAWRTMCNRHRVAYFEVGDLGRNRTKKRFISRALSYPWRSSNFDGSWPCRINIPTDIRTVREKGKLPYSESNWEERIFRHPLEASQAWMDCQEIIRKATKSNRSYLRISTHPANSISVEGIRGVIESWAKEDWMATCVVIDYADILAPLKHTYKRDIRDQINETWIELRRMSQELHALVVTATQADADGYNRWVLDKKNFNGDRRKNDHVTAMIGINQSPEEKERGQVRWNFIDRREAQFNSKQCLFIAQALGIGHPVSVSTF